MSTSDKCVVSRLSKVGVDREKQRRQSVLNRLYMATILCGSFLIVEAVGGYLAGSLAVMSDAAHLFSDLASFAVAIAASYLASLPPSDTHTYGLKRSESLAALFSMLSLAFVSILLAYEAIQRLIVPPQNGINGVLMSEIAAIGVLVNIALAFVLGAENHIHMPGASHGHGHHDHGHGHDHNHGHGHDHDNHENSKTSTTKSSSKCKGHNHHDHEHHATDVVNHVGHHDHGHSHGHESHQNTPNDEEHGGNHDHHDHAHGHAHAQETDALLNCSKNNNHHHGHQYNHHEAAHHESTSDHDNVNLHAAYLHVIGDLLQSVAVLIAGIVISIKPEWHIVDPVVTLIFCMYIFHSTVGVIRTSIAVLLEESPPNISWQEVYDCIARIDCVTNVHHLHIWSISHGEPALSVHCNCILLDDANLPTVTTTKCIDKIYKEVNKQFGFTHVAIQVQSEDGPCVTCSSCPFGEQDTSDHQ